MGLLVTNPPTMASAPAPAASGFSDIRDIKPPVFIPNGYEWLWWVAGALALVVLALLIWFLLRKQRQRAALPPPIAPAHVRARQRLRQALQLLTQPKPFCIAVSDAARLYLEERFRFRAPERTTEEFLRELGATVLLSNPQKESLGQFLESCDMVKFAKYEPGEAELRELYGSAMRLVDETAETTTEIPGSEIQVPVAETK
jgi:hypothetical protein